VYDIVYYIYMYNYSFNEDLPACHGWMETTWLKNTSPRPKVFFGRIAVFGLFELLTCLCDLCNCPGSHVAWPLLWTLDRFGLGMC
jgi:hypothetical protein